MLAAIEKAQRWAIHDPDPVTRGAIDRMVDRADPELVSMFGGRIAFGTAGLRAAVGPGPQSMNALVVRQATAAVVDWIKANGQAAPKIVIGFDARHDSQRFARHAAAAAIAHGATPLLADAAAPTPVFAHALLAEHAHAGIVVTASHNPPADNGYKLYLHDGIQLVSPADAEIAARIDAMAAAWHDFGPAIDDAYAQLDDDDTVSTQAWVAGHRASALAALATEHRSVQVAYTAMHGVGGQPVLDAFEAAGFNAPVSVPEQFDPDPDFSTVPFPNPEEPGAFDLVLALAQATGADCALANDPDADRLAMAVPSREGGAFVPLSGNELGVLLADHVLGTTAQAGADDGVVARSVVSSRQLDAMANAAGVQCEVTLTGFKWVARPIVDLAPQPYLFGYEEAIGYCIGDRVRDKDGITAALVAAEMVAGLKANGRTVWDRLDELAEAHGVFLNHPISVRFDDEPARVHELMDRIAADPPTELAGVGVAQSGPVGLGSLGPTPGLHLVLNDETQLIIRPSGTEPKIKAYLEVVQPVVDRNVAAARSVAQQRLDSLVLAVSDLLA